MLDSLKFIHQKDAQDALGIAERQWQQLLTDYAPVEIASGAQNVVFAGMGGSALAALVSTTWPKCRVPFQIVRDYQVPKYVNEQTLFIASSYSGNTEETLSALRDAQQKKAQIAVITSGGVLLEEAKKHNYPHVVLPDVGQPRFGMLASLKALAVILEAADLACCSDAPVQELEEFADWLKQEVQQWIATVPTAQNTAKQLALDCIGKSPVVYAGGLLFPAAYKWKISFNENAKNVAWCGALPEFSHNEFIGWSSHPVEKPYKVIDLRSNLDHPQVQKRFAVSERLLSGNRPTAHVVEAKGENVLQQLVWTSVFGDFVSLYTALLNDLDPTPVALIEKMKKELA